MSSDSAKRGRRQGRPLGDASGGDPGFWERLGVGEDGLPVHLPMGVNEHGQGPEDDSAAYTYVCWCGDAECPLALALGHAWASGKRIGRTALGLFIDEDGALTGSTSLCATLPEGGIMRVAEKCELLDETWDAIIDAVEGGRRPGGD